MMYGVDTCVRILVWTRGALGVVMVVIRVEGVVVGILYACTADVWQVQKQKCTTDAL